MKPILFPKNSTVFDTNGLGRLECISCTVTEERNGEYTFQMEIAETALHASEIQLSSIIVAKPSDGATNQAFRVYKITKPLNGIFAVLAEHISYQLSYIPTMPFSVTASSGACAQVLAALKTNAVESCPFNFSTDVTTVASYNQAVPASIRSRLGGVEGSVLDQFRGEYEWDNYNVIFHENRGRIIPNVSLRYGKNITDINQESNIESTITGIVPYWMATEGDTLITLPERVVEGAHASSFPFKRTVPIDFSQDFDEEPTVAQLRARAQAYVNASGIGIPKVSIKLSFVNLADTEEYKNLAALQTVKLCDNIEVYFEKLDIATTAKVVRTEYDVLLERYNSIEIGDLRSTLSGVISSTEGAIAQVANDTRRMFKNYNKDIEGLVDNATAWLTGSNGYVVAHRYPESEGGAWKELLFLDRRDEEEAVNVLRVNENGLGFSHNGVNGPYTQAWTLDGKMVIGGTNVPSLTVYNNQNQVLFQISASGMTWNANNSSMAYDGTLTIKGPNNTTIATFGPSGIDVKKGSIKGTTLTVGGAGNADGSINVTDANGNNIGTWNNVGLDVKKGSIKGASLTVGGNNNADGYVSVHDASSNEIARLDNNGLDVKKGSIKGASVTVGGNNNADGQINVNDSSGNNIGTWNKDGLNVKSGTITGSTVRTAESGAKMQMDNSSTLKGMRDNTLHNAINMMQGSTNQMTIDADTQLNIRTPKVYVTDQSAGMGSATVYGTQTDSLADFQNETYDTGRLCYRILDVRKLMPADDPTDQYKMREIEIKGVGTGEGDVRCTLPVFLKFRYKNERRMHGMVLSGTTAQSFVV